MKGSAGPKLQKPTKNSGLDSKVRAEHITVEQYLKMAEVLTL